MDTYSVLEQLEGFFKVFPLWWNCRSSLTGISANGASPVEKQDVQSSCIAYSCIASEFMVVISNLSSREGQIFYKSKLIELTECCHFIQEDTK